MTVGANDFAFLHFTHYPFLRPPHSDRTGNGNLFLLRVKMMKIECDYIILRTKKAPKQCFLTVHPSFCFLPSFCNFGYPFLLVPLIERSLIRFLLITICCIPCRATHKCHNVFYRMVAATILSLRKLLRLANVSGTSLA